MKTALWPLQVSIVNRLKNDAALSARAKVYDSVPESASYPRVVVGEDTVVPNYTKTGNGEEITHTLHIWSRYNGKKEVKELMALVLDSLTNSPLSLADGFEMEFNMLDFAEVLPDPDGITKHGVIRLRFIIRQGV